MLGGALLVCVGLGAQRVALAQLQEGSAMMAGGQYEKEDSFVGSDFFTKWTFYDGGDPTHGTVDFVTQQEAEQQKLISASADKVYMGVDSWSTLPPGQGRKAVKILSRKTYNNGLFILTAENVPSACGAWPAFWMYGEDAQHAWPRWGEYDILESVHTLPWAATTLHTKYGCDQAVVDQGLDFTGTGWAAGSVGNQATNCWVNAPNEYNNQGCGQKMPDGSFGPGLNANGGGTWAAEWDPIAKHLRTWFWPKGKEPYDIAAGKPNPDYWGTPSSFFTLASRFCSTDHFKNMRMVFDTTFCGDYANPSFAGACPNAGMSCDAYVRTQPNAMKDAFWSVTRLDVYQRKGYEKAVDNPEYGAGISANHPDHPQSSGPNWILPLFVILCLSALGYYIFKRLGQRFRGVADCNEKLAEACDDGKQRRSSRTREVSMSPSTSTRELADKRPASQSPKAEAPASPERRPAAGASSIWKQFTGAASGFTAVPPNSPPPASAQARQSSTFVTAANTTPVPSGSRSFQPNMPSFQPSGLQSFAPLSMQGNWGQAQASFNIVPEPGQSFAPLRNAPTFTGHGSEGSGAMGSRDLALPPTLPYNQGGRR